MMSLNEFVLTAMIGLKFIILRHHFTNRLNTAGPSSKEINIFTVYIVVLYSCRKVVSDEIGKKLVDAILFLRFLT